jgi:hypothetical protein
MLQVEEDLDTLLDDVVRLHALNVGDEADPTSVPLLTGIVESLPWR